MDRNSEIESKLLSITENYKREFSSKFKKSNSVRIIIQSKYPLLKELDKKLSIELINVANKYLDDNNIADKKQLNDFIGDCVSDFTRFCLDS